MDNDIRDLTDAEIRERLAELREARKTSYSQVGKKKARSKDPVVDPRAAEILLQKIEEFGSLEALLEHERKLDLEAEQAEQAAETEEETDDS